jgi:hypothetical protein
MKELAKTHLDILKFSLNATFLAVIFYSSTYSIATFAYKTYCEVKLDNMIEYAMTLDHQSNEFQTIVLEIDTLESRI